jgi:hypothetical protein
MKRTKGETGVSKECQGHREEQLPTGQKIPGGLAIVRIGRESLLDDETIFATLTVNKPEAFFIDEGDSVQGNIERFSTPRLINSCLSTADLQASGWLIKQRIFLLDLLRPSASTIVEIRSKTLRKIFLTLRFNLGTQIEITLEGARQARRGSRGWRRANEEARKILSKPPRGGERVK